MAQLSDRGKADIKERIDKGLPLPAKYKASLFEDSKEVELIWPGKTNEVTNIVLPFQTIEQIDEPREEQYSSDFVWDSETGRQTGGWSNKLIWGDNKLILSSLKNGPLRRDIEKAGGLKLIYIDPPFDTGADFSFSVEIDDDTSLTKQPSVLEELAYRDTWGERGERYLQYMYERLILMRDLLAEDGSIYVHCDWRVNSYIRLVLDQVFGKNVFRNAIAWHYSGWNKKLSKSFEKRHDTIFLYSKSERPVFNSFFRPWESREAYVKARKQKIRLDEDQREYVLSDAGGGQRIKRYLDDAIKEGVVVDDVWNLDKINNSAKEAVGYPTQKPSSLLERIIQASSNEGDLIADFFCGSGTTLAVAEKLGRKWIGCDLGRFAIHTTRKRMIGVQRQLKSEGNLYRSFEILNLGKYERQYFVGINPNLSEQEKEKVSLKKEYEYVQLVLEAYKAQRIEQSPPFHGRKGKAMIVVGPIDAPVTDSLVNEVVQASIDRGITYVDVLGFDFEMGLNPKAQDEASKKGVRLALKIIPKEVFDRRAVEKGQAKFYDVGYLDAKCSVGTDHKVTVTLKGYAVFYRQDDDSDAKGALKPGASKVIVENGNVVRLHKDSKGHVNRELLTKKWSDWVDYWAVDFDYENRREIIRIVEKSEDSPDGENSCEREVWTGGYIFENEWQSFRTRKDRTLELTSAAHQYPKKGKYKIAVKVIDIFGNDTTRVLEVNV